MVQGVDLFKRRGGGGLILFLFSFLRFIIY